jgi:hypothetical protein
LTLYRMMAGHSPDSPSTSAAVRTHGKSVMTSDHKGYGIHVTARRVPIVPANRWYVYAVVYHPVGSAGRRSKRLSPMGAPFESKSVAEEQALKMARQYIDQHSASSDRPLTVRRDRGE